MDWTGLDPTQQSSPLRAPYGANKVIQVILMNLVGMRNLMILVIVVNVCDSGNFKNYGAFDESAYSITPYHFDEIGNSDESSDTGDLGNTGGSEKSDDSDYFCTMSDSGISEESGAFSD